MQDIEKILQERADQLAKAPLQTSESEALLSDVILFSLSNERYALEVSFVKEVVPLKEVTKLPFAPTHIYGLINVRSQIYCVVDLRELLYLEKISQDAQVILLENKEASFGIITEEVLGIKKININHLQNPLPSMTGVYQEFLKGIDEERLILLDGEKLLNSSLIIVNETV